MWRPQSWSEIEGLIGQAEESAYLDFKRKLSGDGRELAKDIAAMTVDGGVLLYGIDEEKPGGLAGAIIKVALKGQEERLRQIANSTIHPAPAFEVIYMREAPADPDGVIAVVVPPSPLAPHAVGERFPRRDGTTTKYLSEPEIDRLYRLRRHAASAGSEPLELLSAAAHLPGIEDDGERGMGMHLGVVRVAGRLSGDARHPDDPWLQDSLAAAAREADPQLQARPSADRPFLLGYLQRRGWRPDGVEGWVAGLVKNDAATLWRTNTVAGVLRYPSHILLQVTMPLALSVEGESLDYDCAYEWMVVRETVAALAFIGSWFAGFPAAGGCQVAVGLRGFSEAVPYAATRAEPGMDAGLYEPAPDSMADATNTSAIELTESPDAVGRRLIERWVAGAGGGPDLFEKTLS
jgi:hypothetical protein